jgi:hypothetical protein
MAGEPLLPIFVGNVVLMWNTEHNAFFDSDSFLDVATEEQRVNLRVGGLKRLAAEANMDFWVDEERCRRIV